MSNQEKTPLVIIACKVLQDLLEAILPEHFADQVIFMDYGLHRFPQKMTLALQEVINDLKDPGTVILGYGLCGKGLIGIEAYKHTLLIPRVDDCIAMLLGSYQSYIREFEAEPGTYYLSKGWLESGSHPLKEYEEYCEKYGRDDAAWIMDQQYRNYRRLALVTHTQADMEKYRPQAQAIGRYCAQWNIRYEEILGSNRYIRRLIEVGASIDKADDDFVVIPPGGKIRREQFIRPQVTKIGYKH
jgi:hypothetical protein